jgi:hypothetical protein
VIDDFAPTGTSIDVQRLHRDADRVLRAQGNNAGRQRMRPDATLKPSKPPRGLILSTGEDTPKGQSLRARMLIVEVGPSDVDRPLLTKAQADAANGVYAWVMAAFLRWLSPRYDQVRRDLRSRLIKLRLTSTGSAAHRRTPEIISNLAVGLDYFLEFAREIGAITGVEAAKIQERCWKGLGRAADAQAEQQQASEPAHRFLELLSTALASGRAHVAASDGTQPPHPEAWGWREVTLGTGENIREDWWPKGDRIGWLDAKDLFLDVDAAYSSTQTIGKNLGDGISLTPRRLCKRLDEKGFLKTKGESRETLKVRRRLEGKRREVLHLEATLLEQCAFSPTDQPRQADSDAEAGRREATDASAFADFDDLPTTVPMSINPSREPGSSHLVGLVGLNEMEKADQQQNDQENPFSLFAHTESNPQPCIAIENPTNLTRAESEGEISGEELV